MRIVEADEPSIVGIVHGQRIFDPVGTARTGSHAPDCKLHPISSGLIDDVDVSVQIEQILQCMVLLGVFHSRRLSEDDN